jgi:hypothetical protein
MADKVKVKSYARRKPASAPKEAPPEAQGVVVTSVNKEPRRTASKPLKIVSGNNPENTTSRDTIGVKVVSGTSVADKGAR